MDTSNSYETPQESQSRLEAMLASIVGDINLPEEDLIAVDNLLALGITPAPPSTPMECPGAPVRPMYTEGTTLEIESDTDDEEDFIPQPYSLSVADGTYQAWVQAQAKRPMPRMPPVSRTLSYAEQAPWSPTTTAGPPNWVEARRKLVRQNAVQPCEYMVTNTNNVEVITIL